MSDEKTPSSIDEYIAGFDKDIQAILQKTRETIRAQLPDADEKIAWGMPTFWQEGENIIHFAASKKHFGIYGNTSNLPFADKLKTYTHSKGAIQFPYDKPVPYDFIAELAVFKLKEAHERMAIKKAKKAASKKST